MGVYFDGATKMAECDWCGKKFKYTGWNNFGKKYCCTKCRAEAEGGTGGGSGKSDDGSSSSGSGGMGAIGSVIGGVVLILLLIIVIGIIFSKDGDTNDPAAKIAKASESSAEASSSEKSEKVENIVEKYKEHMEKRMSLLSEGLADKQVNEMGYNDYTLDAFKQNYKNIKYKTLEEIKQSSAATEVKVEDPKPVTSPKKSSKSSSYKVEMMGDVAIVIVTSEADTRQEAWQAAFRTAVKGAVSSFVGDMELLQENKDRFDERLNTVGKADVKQYKTIKDLHSDGVFTVNISAKLNKKDLAPKFAEVFPKSFVMSKAAASRKPVASAVTAEPTSKARVAAETMAEAKSNDSVEAEGVVGEQQSGADHKAAKDSKGIRIVVKGKGKTKEAAVRWAIRDAVWKTVGTWVDSKSRIQENHDKVVALVKTITEADVPKFEVIDTQEQDGGFVVKVRVFVSKKKIAPKFAEIFPDVFTID